MTPERMKEIAEVFAVALAERQGRTDEDLRRIRGWYTMAFPPVDGSLLAFCEAADAFVLGRFGGGTIPPDLAWADDLEALSWVITPIEAPLGPV